jgi:hypothetical protein
MSSFNEGMHLPGIFFLLMIRLIQQMGKPLCRRKRAFGRRLDSVSEQGPPISVRTPFL